MAMPLPPASASMALATAMDSPCPPKAASRLLFRLRHTNSSLKSTLRRSQHLSKSALLAALRQLLLQHDWQLALPMYLFISEAPWYKWNAHLHAHMVALLTKFEQQHQADLFMVDIGEKLDSKQLLRLNSALIQHYGRYGLKAEMLATCRRLEALPNPGAIFLSRISLLQAYASMDSPKEAEETLRDMRSSGFKPSPEDFKAVLFSYGRCGLFGEMEAFACEMEKCGLLLDPVVFNMIITTYATGKKHDKIKDWLGKMSVANIPPSVRSLNALSKACPILNIVCAGSSCSASFRLDGLLKKLEAHGATPGELQTVTYLLELALVQEAVVWTPHWQLDLHSTDTGSAYVMLVCWLKEMLHRLKVERASPSEIIIVTGWGKHSEMRGSSPVRSMVINLLTGIGSPFMVDSKNKGRLLARPHAMAAWLSQL